MHVRATMALLTEPEFLFRAQMNNDANEDEIQLLDTLQRVPLDVLGIAVSAACRVRFSRNYLYLF